MRQVSLAFGKGVQFGGKSAEVDYTGLVLHCYFHWIRAHNVSRLPNGIEETAMIQTSDEWPRFAHFYVTVRGASASECWRVHRTFGSVDPIPIRSLALDPEPERSSPKEAFL